MPLSRGGICLEETRIKIPTAVAFLKQKPQDTKDLLEKNIWKLLVCFGSFGVFFTNGR